ncbi:hypothetical protein V5F49_15310 [Xanthobacter sp. V3C-3]
MAHRLGGAPIYEVLLDRTLRLAGTPRATPAAEEQIGGWDERERRTGA